MILALNGLLHLRLSCANDRYRAYPSFLPIETACDPTVFGTSRANVLTNVGWGWRSRNAQSMRKGTLTLKVLP